MSNLAFGYRIPKIEEFIPGFKYEMSTQGVLNTMQDGYSHKATWHEYFFPNIYSIDAIEASLLCGYIRVKNILIIEEELFTYAEYEGRAELKIHIHKIPKDCKKINKFYDFEIEILNKINPDFFEEWELCRVINGKIDRESICGEWKPSTMYSHIDDYELLLIKKDVNRN